MAYIQTRVKLRRDTTANWASHPDFIPMNGEIIIYTDHELRTTGGYSPGVKIGDGNAYLIDLPFVGEERRDSILAALEAHEKDSIIHITQGERNFWNAKLNCVVSGEELILTRD